MSLNRILNVGCGNETFGTDFVDKYPQRKEVLKCDIDNEDLPFANNLFDIVYSKNIFEHLKNPNSAIRKMLRVLKKGGKLVLITDNAGYIFHHIDLSSISDDRASHQKDEHYRGYGIEDRHFSLFTSLHLIHHFNEFGLKNIRWKYRFDRSFTWKNNLLYYFCSLIPKEIGMPRIEIMGRKT